MTTGTDGAALIDSLTDDELARLAGRLQIWERGQYPMRDVLGEVVPFAAPTGRVQVSPGQTIQSQWGNTVWDQSLNCFNNTADRDTQWPTPHDGSTCFTNDTGTIWLRVAGVWRAMGSPPFSRFANFSGSVGASSSASMCLVPNEPGYWSSSGTTLTFLRAGLYACTLSADVPATTDIAIFLRIMQASNLYRTQARFHVTGATNFASVTWQGYRAVNDVLILDLTNSTAGPLTFNRSQWLSYLGGG